ncbi:MAG TPA: S8 family serine peptidase, partial [Gemmatimonadaceae bacterium]
ASAASAITVGATTNTDTQASYSNYGTCVDLFAPGSSIYSAMNTDDYSMGYSNGTSMATPHVAGAAALYLQANPSASPAEVASAIMSSSTSGALTALGSGSPNNLLRVNGNGGSVTLPPPPPPPVEPTPAPAPNAAPTPSFSVSCQKGSCSFDGSASSDDQGVTSYQWTFGDGSSSASAASPYTTHNYTQKGNYSVTVGLTVSDAAGLKNTTYKTVSIKNNGK